MKYLVTFEDGSSRYLSHHGVKGMKWGVWNEETKERYGYTMLPGSKIRRLASEHEGREGTDLSRPFYASTNEEDYRKYVSVMEEGLPSTKNEETVASIAMKAVKPVTVASGRQLVSDLFGIEDGIDDWGDIGKHLTLDQRIEAKRAVRDPEVREKYRKRGYDAIEDLEDQTIFFAGGNPKHPLIVLNGNKFERDEEETQFLPNARTARRARALGIYPEW